ncbi:MAG: hypothetical protein JXA94_02485 [Parachlamydiales bacterium]|nr:hypothetical protein [Parachlamydiales bacterium]
MKIKAKKLLKIILISIASLFLIILFFQISELSIKDNAFNKAYTWVRFRFNYPDDRYLYNDYYRNRYVKVHLDIYDSSNSEIVDVQIANKRIYLTEAQSNDKRADMYLTLKPGIYTIKWRVATKRYAWGNYMNYVRKIKISRNDNFIRIVIKGNRLYYHSS